MLEEYKDILAALAGFANISQMFSGVFMCKNIYKTGSTKNFPSTPFVTGFVVSILFLQQGVLLKDNTLEFVYFVGIAIHLCYLVFFYAWSAIEEKHKLQKQLTISIAILAVLLGYVRLENPTVVALRFGTIISGALLFHIGSPLLSIGKIIRTKNTDIIPFPIVANGTIVGILWLLYGLASHQYFLFYQRMVFLSLSVPQIVLCLMYPSTKAKTP